jgi:hypothetical protein
VYRFEQQLQQPSDYQIFREEQQSQTTTEVEKIYSIAFSTATVIQQCKNYIPKLFVTIKFLQKLRAF